LESSVRQQRQLRKGIQGDHDVGLLVDDQPWRRAYVVLKPGAKDSFVAKTGS